MASATFTFITKHLFVAVCVLAAWAHFTRQKTEAQTVATVRARSR